MNDIFFRHPEHPSGPVVGYYCVIGADGGRITTHFYEIGYQSEALSHASSVADRNSTTLERPAIVVHWDKEESVTVYTGRAIQHDLRPTSKAVGTIDRSVSTVCVKRNGVYRQEDV